MIKSITFNGDAGYITMKIPEPNCHVRGIYDENTKYFSKHWFSDDDIKEIKKWQKKYKEWEKVKDNYKNPILVKNLLNRKIEFAPNKINLIFGPNASGKTTILKALGGNACTTDGYAKIVTPCEFGHHIGENETKDELKKYIYNMMGNTADIEWDGAPVYYDNFGSKINQGHGSIGDLCGSVLGDEIGTEILYCMNRDKISLGQNSIYLLNRLLSIAKEQTCYGELFKDFLNSDFTRKELRVNDIWEDTYNKQLDYLLGFEKSLVKSPSTFLFDELDKSLDIVNIYALYTEVLPKVVEETGIQIIIISHSPLVLSDKIRNNEKYNFISMDDNYTNECLEKMNNLFG